MNKINHIWSVLCKESIIGQDDNVISLIGVLEELTVNLTPIKGAPFPPNQNVNIPINYEIISFWAKENLNEEAKANIQISVINPDDKETILFNQELKIPENLKRFRSRFKISGMTAHKDGIYFFKVAMKEEKESKVVSKIPLEVKIIY
jgi:hypothetical protein